MDFPFIRTSPFFMAASTALVTASIVLLFYPGPKLSIDFQGGTFMEIKIPSSSTKNALESALKSLKFTNEETGAAVELGNFTISETRAQTMVIRMRDLSNQEHIKLLDHITASLGETEEMQFTTIGPTVGSSLKQRSMWALCIASAAIVLYIAFAFRKVPRRLSPWRFGIIAVIALIHDVLITTGVFVILSRFTAFEFDTLFITALLTIIGYSVNDTIVVFDRIRDNLLTQNRGEDFALVANRSLNQSLTRSINTSFTTLIMLAALFLFGPGSIKWFVLALIVGIVSGTYSSIFLATPMLVYWRKK